MYPIQGNRRRKYVANGKEPDELSVQKKLQWKMWGAPGGGVHTPERVIFTFIK